MLKPKPVYKYDMEGNFLAGYDSINLAAKKNNLHFSGVRKAAKGDYSYSGNFIWSHEKHKKIKPALKSIYESSRSRFVAVVARKGNREIVFDSISEAARFIGCHRSAVSQIINKLSNMYTIYGWSIEKA